MSEPTPSDALAADMRLPAMTSVLTQAPTRNPISCISSSVIPDTATVTTGVRTPRNHASAAGVTLERQERRATVRAMMNMPLPARAGRGRGCRS
jgi:hypothetical protein